MRVVHDAVKVQSQGAESSVVGVREAIDNSVKGITADGIIVVF